VDVEDFRCNTPLYYACTHSGEESVLADDESKRIAIVLALMDAGGDPWKQGGFTCKASVIRAAELGYTDTALAMRDHPFLDVVRKIRDSVNLDLSSLPAHAQVTIRIYADQHWRCQTLGWLSNMARHNMMQCFKPHPAVLRGYNRTPTAIEAMFRDCGRRHKAWVKELQAFLDMPDQVSGS
jgi:hypothetical protein